VFGRRVGVVDSFRVGCTNTEIQNSTRCRYTVDLKEIKERQGQVVQDTAAAEKELYCFLVASFGSPVQCCFPEARTQIDVGLGLDQHLCNIMIA
jgi:hypothetical protein